MTRSRAGWLVAFCCASCGSPPAPSPPATKPVPSAGAPPEAAPLPAASSAAPPSPAAPRPPVPAEATRKRAAGLEALDADRLVEAEKAFADALDVAPGNEAAKALYDAAVAARRKAQERASADLSNLTPIRLQAPPFAYTLRSTALPLQKGPPPSLSKVSDAKTRGDRKAWLAANGLGPRTLDLADLPPHLPTQFGGERLAQAIAHDDHTVLVFGRTVAAVDGRGRVLGVYDFNQYGRPTLAPFAYGSSPTQFVAWAQVEGSVLYVATRHTDAAASSGGKNAFVTALALVDGQLLWQSQPLVANASDFVMRGGFIVSAYGLGTEPDFLYVLDQATGKVVGRTPIGGAPDFLVEKAGRLYVRTQDREYVFDFR